MINRDFEDVFSVSKPIIGMIHLAGYDSKERIKRGLDELVLYQEEEVDGAIIEDYHGTIEEVYETLVQSMSLKLKLVRGINLLSDPYGSLKMASAFGAKFVQFDSVQTADLDPLLYEVNRIQYSDVSVLGGVGFKYTKPTGNTLEFDLNYGKSRCEAIVTTGSGTGIETPLEKLKEYKRLLGDFPLIVGAGVTLQNVGDQMRVADGAIIGSYFKQNGQTRSDIKREKVRDLMNIVKDIRAAEVKYSR